MIKLDNRDGKPFYLFFHAIRPKNEIQRAAFFFNIVDSIQY